MDDPIRQLLLHTDAALGSPPATRNVSDRVRKRARNQRRLRVVTAGIAIALLCIGIVFIHPPKTPPAIVAHLAPPPPQDTRSDETDVKLHQLVAQLLEKHEREAARANIPEPDDYLWQLSQERDRAALILVRGGDRIYRESHDRPAAEANYRQAIRLFPESPAASLAEQRLRNIDQKGNES